MSERVIVFGSIGLDTVETPFGKRENILGGSGTYAALSASYFAQVVLVSAVGEDFSPKHRELFTPHSIDMENVELREGKTFSWHAQYGENPNERKVLSTCENVLKDYTPSILPEYENIEYIFLANNSPTSQLLLLERMKNLKLVVWDTMSFWIEKYPHQIREILPKVDIALFNDSEAKQFSGDVNLLKSARKILSLGVRKGVIIKKGEHGAVLVTPSFIFCVPAFPLEKVKDPTGAGDSFAGGLTGFLVGKEINDENLKKSLVHGTIMASFTVEEFGVERIISLTQEQIRERYTQLKKLTYF